MPGGFAAEAAADVVAAGGEQGAAVALAELAGLEQLEQPRREGRGGGSGWRPRGGCGRPGGRAPLWRAPSSSTSAAQARASSTGLRSSRTMFSISATCSRSACSESRTTAGTFVEAGLLGGAPAALAGDQLVAAVVERADEQRLDDAAGLDRGGERVERLRVELGAGLVRVRLDQARPAARAARRRRPRSASGRIAARPRPIPPA